jgi:hypothetical protein
MCFFIVAGILLTGPACRQDGPVRTGNNTSGGWLLLFDGCSLDQWQSSTTDDDVSACWRIRDGSLCGVPRRERPEGVHASLLSKRQFGNFELRFEFKLDAPTTETATNSGVKYFVYPDTELGLEYQLYARVGEIPGPHATADLYDILSAQGARLQPFAEWNSARIISNGTRCEHWLNGVRVLVYDRGGQIFRAAIAKSKFKDRDRFGELPAGHIMLQDHGGGVRFRDIKIREL